MIFDGMIPDGLDPISVYGRQLDWALHGIHPETVDPRLAFATIAYGIFYTIIILGTPGLAMLLHLAWKDFQAWMREIQVHPEDR